MTRMTSPSALIEARNLSKRYGTRLVVRDLSFTVRPGRVTGFLGPNGAGKSTTMRLLLGLDRPTAGQATIGGRAYRDLPRPLVTVGAMLEAKAVHQGRTAGHHLLGLARTQGIPGRRVDEVLELVGLAAARDRRAGTFSLGMSQRLGLAAALLGDPEVLMLDEPVNGLDPEGIVWIRNVLKGLALEGRTVLVSSHLMTEMAMTAQHLIVIGRGRLIADCPTEEFIAQGASDAVRVGTPDARELGELLVRQGARVSKEPDGTLIVTGSRPAQIAELAHRNGIVLLELTPQRASLEDAFMHLTRDSVEYDAAEAGA